MERPNLGEENEQLKKDFAEELDAWVERVIDPDMPTEPLGIDPSNMGIDERTFEDLTPKEKFDISESLFDQLGVDPLKIDQLRVRQYPVDENTTAHVYRTTRQTFLQELIDQSGESRFLIGPDENI